MELKKYKVEFLEIRYYKAEMELVATSQEAAECLRDDVDKCDMDWECYNSEITDDDTRETDLLNDADKEELLSISKDSVGDRIKVGDIIRLKDDITSYEFYSTEEAKEEDKIPWSDVRFKIIDIGFDIEHIIELYLYVDVMQPAVRPLISCIEADNIILVGDADTTKLSDRDYWMKHGDCPVCRSGNTVTTLRGQFICNKCDWKK